VLTEASVEGNGRLHVPAARFAAGHYLVRMASRGRDPVHKDFWVQEA
jgi:hypothetical protein